MKAVSADEKKAERAIKITMVTICKALLGSKYNHSFLKLYIHNSITDTIYCQ
jgi:hypothetical protein